MLIADVTNMKGFYHNHEIVFHIPWILRKDQGNVYEYIHTQILHISAYMRQTYSYNCFTIGISVPSLFMDLQRVLWQ